MSNLNDAFKAWFDGSVVTTTGRAGGKPLPVYHGTKYTFSQFDRVSYSHFGYHFGRNPGQANARLDHIQGPAGGQQVKPVYLSIKNPLPCYDVKHWNDPHVVTEGLSRALRRAFIGEGMDEVEAAWEARNAIFKNHSSKGPFTKEERFEVLIKNLEDLGYDGIKYSNRFEGSGLAYIAFHPTQIKSIHNKGTWNPANPNLSENLQERKADKMKESTETGLILKSGEQILKVGQTYVQVNLGVWPESRTVELEWIKARHKGTGAGTVVVQELMRLCTEAGFQLTLFPDTDLPEDDMDRLIRFYQRLGFEMTDLGEMRMTPPGWTDPEEMNESLTWSGHEPPPQKNAHEILNYIQSIHQGDLDDSVLSDNVFSYGNYVLKEVPILSLPLTQFEIDPGKVKKYAHLPPKDSPPIVVSAPLGKTHFFIDGIHRANAQAQAGASTIWAWVGENPQEQDFDESLTWSGHEVFPVKINQLQYLDKDEIRQHRNTDMASYFKTDLAELPPIKVSSYIGTDGKKYYTVEDGRHRVAYALQQGMKTLPAIEVPEGYTDEDEKLYESLTWSGHELSYRTTYLGMPISIENRKGSLRKGVDSDGKKWQTKMTWPYGYIRGTVGVDKDHVDCLLGPNRKSTRVFVIHQIDTKTGEYDEDKCMLGWDDEEEAKSAYLSNYNRSDMFGDIEMLTLDEFKDLAFKHKGKKITLKKEELQEMAYPTEFSMEKLKSIRSYSGRVKYVQSILPRISSGSSRVVFQVDDEKVLKVAKNDKGIAQNASENDWGKQKSAIVAKIFDTDENDIFIEMELAKRVSPALFKKLAGVSMEDLVRALEVEHNKHTYGSRANSSPEDKAFTQKLWDESEFFQELMDLVINFSMPILGDVTKFNSWGVVSRNGVPTLVLIDFGLDETIWNDHYNRKQEKVFGGRADINSEAFKRWFRNSQVVDHSGRPMVVYHGTPWSFNSFDRNQVGATTGQNIEGFFFTDSPKMANGFADYKDLSHERIDPDEITPQVKPCYLRIENPKYVSFYDEGGKGRDFNNVFRDLYRAYGEAVAEGHDGMVITHMSEKFVMGNDDEYPLQFVIFEPNQAKSIYNKGTWSDAKSNLSERTLQAFDVGKIVGLYTDTILDKMETMYDQILKFIPDDQGTMFQPKVAPIQVKEAQERKKRSPQMFNANEELSPRIVKATENILRRVRTIPKDNGFYQLAGALPGFLRAYLSTLLYDQIHELSIGRVVDKIRESNGEYSLWYQIYDGCMNRHKAILAGTDHITFDYEHVVGGKVKALLTTYTVGQGGITLSDYLRHFTTDSYNLENKLLHNSKAGVAEEIGYQYMITDFGLSTKSRKAIISHPNGLDDYPDFIIDTELLDQDSRAVVRKYLQLNPSRYIFVDTKAPIVIGGMGKGNERLQYYTAGKINLGSKALGILPPGQELLSLDAPEERPLTTQQLVKLVQLFMGGTEERPVKDTAKINVARWQKKMEYLNTPGLNLVYHNVGRDASSRPPYYLADIREDESYKLVKVNDFFYKVVNTTSDLAIASLTFYVSEAKRELSARAMEDPRVAAFFQAMDAQDKQEETMSESTLQEDSTTQPQNYSQAVRAYLPFERWFFMWRWTKDGLIKIMPPVGKDEPIMESIAPDDFYGHMASFYKNLTDKEYPIQEFLSKAQDDRFKFFGDKNGGVSLKHITDKVHEIGWAYGKEVGLREALMKAIESVNDTAVFFETEDRQTALNFEAMGMLSVNRNNTKWLVGNHAFFREAIDAMPENHPDRTKVELALK